MSEAGQVRLCVTVVDTGNMMFKFTYLLKFNSTYYFNSGLLVFELLINFSCYYQSNT